VICGYVFRLLLLLPCDARLIRACGLPSGLAGKGSGEKLRFALLSSALLFARANA
jgi:hypothetical protein